MNPNIIELITPWLLTTLKGILNQMPLGAGTALGSYYALKHIAPPLDKLGKNAKKHINRRVKKNPIKKAMNASIIKLKQR